MTTLRNERHVAEDQRKTNERTVSYEFTELIRDRAPPKTPVRSQQLEEVPKLPEETTKDDSQAVAARPIGFMATEPGREDHLRRMNDPAGAEADEIDLYGYM